MAAGDLIAQLDLDDPTAVERAEPYAGGFPELGPPLVHSQGVDHRFAQAETAARMIMAGYDHPVDAVVADLLACLDDPALALLQWTNVFSVVQTRLPVELANELERLAAAHEQDLMCAVGSGSDDGGVDVVLEPGDVGELDDEAVVPCRSACLEVVTALAHPFPRIGAHASMIASTRRRPDTTTPGDARR